MKWIGGIREFEEMVATLSSCRLIAIDTEADSLHSYFDKVCLIQLTSNGDDWVVDPLGKFPIGPIGEILGDPAVVKIFHGADYDLRILNRDFGFEVRNLRDTMVAAQLLGYQAFGLASLLERHFGVTLNKAYQRADWAMRPLTAEMLRYAAMDTRHLEALWAILDAELQRLGRVDWAAEEFERLEAVRYSESERDPESFRKLKGTNRLGRRELAVLARLVEWRDGVARALDRPPFKVASNETLVLMATTLPRSARDLKLVKGMTAGQIARYGGDIVAAIDAACALPEDQLPELDNKKRWTRDKDLEKLIDRLRDERDLIARELSIDGGVLSPRHVLKAIALQNPASVDELASIPAMRRWQIAVAGERLLGALRKC